jgi:hypothetical protein
MHEQLLNGTFAQVSLDRDIPLQVGTVERRNPSLGEKVRWLPRFYS